MFAATPRLRDRFDLRTLVLIGTLALGAFGLQLAFLAGTVASPLGGAIADFERVPQTESGPPQAIARAGAERESGREVTDGARVGWEQPGTMAVAAGTTRQCLVYR